jgi:undecaprenyl-diphosphatase
VLAVAISYSRVYIGVHYLGDVLAGAALGTIWAVGGLAIYYRGAPWIRARRARAYSGRAP